MLIYTCQWWSKPRQVRPPMKGCRTRAIPLSSDDFDNDDNDDDYMLSKSNLWNIIAIRSHQKVKPFKNFCLGSSWNYLPFCLLSLKKCNVFHPVFLYSCRVYHHLTYRVSITDTYNKQDKFAVNQPLDKCRKFQKWRGPHQRGSRFYTWCKKCKKATIWCFGASELT